MICPEVVIISDKHCIRKACVIFAPYLGFADESHFVDGLNSHFPSEIVSSKDEELHHKNHSLSITASEETDN